MQGSLFHRRTIRASSTANAVRSTCDMEQLTTVTNAISRSAREPECGGVRRPYPKLTTFLTLWSGGGVEPPTFRFSGWQPRRLAKRSLPLSAGCLSRPFPPCFVSAGASPCSSRQAALAEARLPVAEEPGNREPLRFRSRYYLLVTKTSATAPAATASRAIRRAV